MDHINVEFGLWRNTIAVPPGREQCDGGRAPVGTAVAPRYGPPAGTWAGPGLRSTAAH